MKKYFRSQIVSKIFKNIYYNFLRYNVKIKIEQGNILVEDKEYNRWMRGCFEELGVEEFLLRYGANRE